MPVTATGRPGEGAPAPAVLGRGDVCVSFRAAVQEERQRGRERAESEAECAGADHEDMPVERILEAELAVEPKTESYGNMSTESSVGGPGPARRRFLGAVGAGDGVCSGPSIYPECWSVSDE